MYKKALEMTHQAPQLHAELQKQIQASQVAVLAVPSFLLFPTVVVERACISVHAAARVLATAESASCRLSAVCDGGAQHISGAQEGHPPDLV